MKLNSMFDWTLLLVARYLRRREVVCSLERVRGLE
jgi:hypothetical protein